MMSGITCTWGKEDVNICEKLKDRHLRVGRRKKNRGQVLWDRLRQRGRDRKKKVDTQRKGIWKGNRERGRKLSWQKNGKVKERLMKAWRKSSDHVMLETLDHAWCSLLFWMATLAGGIKSLLSLRGQLIIQMRIMRTFGEAPQMHSWSSTHL